MYAQTLPYFLRVLYLKTK
uniref:Uncharacterized protein n=1 Tax=Anguilla anguilla TaxID=7936 RepID=A0A0E9URH1_ANGAN